MPSYAYFHKQFVPLSEAKIGVMTHCLHYGTAIFEGIRGNWNSDRKQTYLFRLKDHYERLHKGCRALKINLPYTIDELCQITIELVRRCGFNEDIYTRPLAYKSSESLGVRLHDLDDDFLDKVADKCAQAINKGGLDFVEHAGKEYNRDDFFHVDLRNLN